MEILDKNLELLLKKLLENETTCVSKEECEQSEIDSLIKKGFFTKKDASTFDSWQYLIKPTQEGKYYFSNKRACIQAFRREKTIQWVRYAVPVIISIAALAVSIIALCK